MSAFNLSIEAALNQLDHSNQNHWTADGKPRIDTMRLLTGNNQLTREDIQAKFPDFVRVVQGITPPPPPLPFQIEDSIIEDSIIEDSIIEDSIIDDANLQETLFDGSDDDLSLTQLLEVRQNALDALILQRELLDAKIVEHQAVVNELILKTEIVEKQTNSNAVVIRSYLNSKIQLADEKARKLKILNESGLDLKLLAAELRVSPADQKTRKKV